MKEQLFFIITHFFRTRKTFVVPFFFSYFFHEAHLGDVALGREVNRPSRRIAEKSLTEIFPAEYCLRSAELSNGRPLFFRIFTFANVEIRIKECLILFFFGAMTMRPRYFTAPKIDLPNL